MNDNNIKIEKVILKVKDKELELTIDEIRLLKDVLDSFFENNSPTIVPVFPDYPNPYNPYPYPTIISNVG